MEKPDIDTSKSEIEQLKADIEKLFWPKMVSSMLNLYGAFSGRSFFDRWDVMENMNF